MKRLLFVLILLFISSSFLWAAGLGDAELPIWLYIPLVAIASILSAIFGRKTIKVKDVISLLLSANMSFEEAGDKSQRVLLTLIVPDIVANKIKKLLPLHGSHNMRKALHILEENL